MKIKSTLIFTTLLIFAFSSFAQMKAVVMGSSTAYGTGASTYANSWAGLTEIALNQNASDGADTIIYNIAQPGYTTYQEMPDDFVSPPGRPVPDLDFNVTKALSFSPDVVIINLPSNDISYGYSKAEMINNLRAMSAYIFAGGAKCYITTPQPRNDFTQDMRDSLRQLVDSVNMSFGAYAVDFWNPLVTNDGLYMMKDEYAASPLHVNDAGHQQLFLKIMSSYIFSQAGPVALQLTGFSAQLQNRAVQLRWHTEQQAPNTTFELQRSADGHSFETFYSQRIAEARQSSNYSAMDQTPFSGKSFYRIRITDGGRLSYSSIIDITAPGSSFNISKLYVTSGGSALSAQVDVQKSQYVFINIINNTGAILFKQKQFITQPSESITIPVGMLASGQYYFRITTEDGNTLTKAFGK